MAEGKNDILKTLSGYSLCGTQTGGCKIVGILLEVMRLKDELLYQHSVGVAETIKLLGHAIDHSNVNRLVVAGLLHDIGKIKIPDSILNKQTTPNDREYEIIRMHPIIGTKVLTKYYMQEVAEIILYHHERPDGTGYPYGLSNGKIPGDSKLLAFADVYTALTSYRPYKPAYPHEQAIEITISSLPGFYSPELLLKIKNILHCTYNKGDTVEFFL